MGLGDLGGLRGLGKGMSVLCTRKGVILDTEDGFQRLSMCRNQATQIGTSSNSALKDKLES